MHSYHFELLSLYLRYLKGRNSVYQWLKNGRRKMKANKEKKS